MNRRRFGCRRARVASLSDTGGTRLLLGLQWRVVDQLFSFEGIHCLWASPILMLNAFCLIDR
jgi:hypothetical protein